MATLRNHLKPRAWAGHWGASLSPAVTLESLAWMQNHNIDVRGHVMVWPRYNSVNNFQRAILDIPEADRTDIDLQMLYDSDFDHINDIGGTVQGQVKAWDVINEPRTSNDVVDALVGFVPSNDPEVFSKNALRKRWFVESQAADTGAEMFLNDFSIIAGGDGNTTARDDFHFICGGSDGTKGLINFNNAPIDGFGFQSHFDEANKIPTGPVKVWSLLDEFQSLYGNKKVHITEFDFDTTDEALQADYTRDYLTATFAHETVEAYVFWGVWAGDIGKPEAALFDINFNPLPAGVEYLDLVYNQWWTNETVTSDANGQATIRGFKGDYLVDVQFGGTVITEAVALGNNAQNLTITVPNIAVDSMTVNKGTHNSGTTTTLIASDDVDVSVDQAFELGVVIAEIEFEGTSPVAAPIHFATSIESSVTSLLNRRPARIPTVLKVEFFDFDANQFVTVSTSNASKINDTTVLATGSGNLARFVEDGTGKTRTRVSYQSPALRNQGFVVDIDQLFWQIN